MKRNGKTSAGRTRWRCTSCGASSVRRIDSAAKLLALFLGWLLGRSRQADMPGGGRTFRRKTAAFWEIWPMPPKVEAPRRVVCLDGIHLGLDYGKAALLSVVAVARSTADHERRIASLERQLQNRTI